MGSVGEGVEVELEQEVGYEVVVVVQTFVLGGVVGVSQQHELMRWLACQTVA